MIVSDQFGAEISGPVEDFPAFQRHQPGAVAFLQIENEWIRLGDDVSGKLIEHFLAAGNG